MTGPAAVMLAMVVIGLPTIMIMLIANRFFRYREKRLEVEALNAAEKAAQYASRSSELEERVRVLEQIVTDAAHKPRHRSKRFARSPSPSNRRRPGHARWAKQSRSSLGRPTCPLQC